MNAKPHVDAESIVETAEKPTIVVDEDGEYIAANEEATAICGYDPDEFAGLTMCEIIAEEKVKHGKNLEQILAGNTTTVEAEVYHGDGGTVLIEVHSELIDDSLIKTEIRLIERKKPSDSLAVDDNGTPDPERFENINPAELKQIVRNIRVDAPDGEMSLNAIMLDLAVGHNELEQYKKGALSLHQAIDERFEEEEKRNPDSKECDVLREVKEVAYGLYLRIQRGDEELHGHRDGKYSGYFS